MNVLFIWMYAFLLQWKSALSDFISRFFHLVFWYYRSRYEIVWYHHCVIYDSILEMYDVVILMDFESILIWWNDFKCALIKVHELEQYGSSNLISTIEKLLEFSAAGILQHMAGLKTQIGQSPGHLDLESGLRINFLSKTFWTFTVSCFYFRFS